MTSNKNDFPKRMRKIDQWIQWLNVDGVKIPMQCYPKGKASSTDPDTWYCFYDAFQFNPDKRTGIGFVLTADDGLVVFDFDHVRDPVTGDTVEWAAKLIEKLDSLTYISTSGSGYHVWMRCTKPLPGAGLSMKHPSDPDTALEIFEQKRFMVMSGNLFKKTDIKDRTKRILKIYKQMQEHKAKQKEKKNVKAKSLVKKPFMNVGGSGITLKQFLDHNSVTYKEASFPRADDGVKFQMECPWGDNHTDAKNAIGAAAVWTETTWCFKCRHNHCSDKSIKDFTAEVKR
jgi:primase-polymerase (primpol)-like protein